MFAIHSCKMNQQVELFSNSISFELIHFIDLHFTFAANVDT